jgi:hypothetical protein
MTDAVRKRYDAEYGAIDAAERLRGDMSIIVPKKVPAMEKYLMTMGATSQIHRDFEIIIQET